MKTISFSQAWKKCSQMFNQSFETGGRTVFKVGVGFQILPQGKAGMIQNNFKVLVSLIYFKVLVILKYFKVLAGLRSQFEYSTSDFTGITMPSCIKIKRLPFGSPFQKALGLWNLGKVLHLYLNYSSMSLGRPFEMFLKSAVKTMKNLTVHYACIILREYYFSWLSEKHSQSVELDYFDWNIFEETK